MEQTALASGRRGTHESECGKRHLLPRTPDLCDVFHDRWSLCLHSVDVLLRLAAKHFCMIMVMWRRRRKLYTSPQREAEKRKKVDSTHVPYLWTTKSTRRQGYGSQIIVPQYSFSFRPSREAWTSSLDLFLFSLVSGTALTLCW